MIEQALEKLTAAINKNTAATLELKELLTAGKVATVAAPEPEAEVEKPKAHTRTPKPKPVPVEEAAPEPTPEVEPEAQPEPEPEVEHTPEPAVEAAPVSRENLIAQIQETVKQKIVNAKDRDGVKTAWTSIREGYGVNAISDLETVELLAEALVKAQNL